LDILDVKVTEFYAVIFGSRGSKTLLVIFKKFGISNVLQKKAIFELRNKSLKIW